MTLEGCQAKSAKKGEMLPRKREVRLIGRLVPRCSWHHVHSEGAACKGEAPPRRCALAAYPHVIDGSVP